MRVFLRTARKKLKNTELQNQENNTEKSDRLLKFALKFIFA